MYDAVVVGARCAGAPTAMHLARRGHRVLLCDRAAFPSDTVSNGFFQAPAVQYLRRWGLLDRLVATGVPPITVFLTTLAGTEFKTELPRDWALYAPTRRVLDAMLVEAAVEAGAELVERANVTGVVVDGDGDGRVAGITYEGENGTQELRARIVVGADGRHSSFAKLVGAERYDVVAVEGAGAYAYFEDLPVVGYEFHYPDTRTQLMMAPSNDGMTCLLAAGGEGADPQARFDHVLARVPQLADRLADARQVGKLVPYRLEDLYYRPAFGPGWALVGDAGFHPGPVAGLGMSHAFRDAERLGAAVDSFLTGAEDFDRAMAGYSADREAASRPMYEATAAAVGAEGDPMAAQAAMTRHNNLVRDWIARLAAEDAALA